MRRRWRLRPCPPEAEVALRNALGLRPHVARILASRGIDSPERAGAFLQPRLSEHLRSPMLFRQMPAAVERVTQALSRKEQIGIYGDYDVDGMSGSALLVRFFRSLGCSPELFIPHRMTDGYGLTERGIRKLSAAGVNLMITVDCGGVSHREIAVAGQLGIDTIVCDHHQVSGTPLPACAVLNPIEVDAGFPFNGLCGAGVAFYLAMGVRMRLREAGRQQLPDLRRYLDLVALGTIADVVPLLEENRVLVHAGLREILQSAMPGIVALKQVSRVDAVSASAIGFRLAPRLNAAGRLSDATRAVELLTTDDAERAAAIARDLDAENTTRREIEAEMVADAVRRVEREGLDAGHGAIVVADDSFHPGVVGIVAARLVDRFHRPSVVIAVDPATGMGRGSGRSIAGIDLHEAFRRASAHLAGFGGHHMAAGLSLHADRIPDFRAALNATVSTLAAQIDATPETFVDGEVGLDAFDAGFVDALEPLAPHGASNPEPVFLVRGATVAGRRVVGERHLKLFLRQPRGALAAMAFGLADSGIEQGAEIDILVTPERNAWQGRNSIELRVHDWRPAKPA